MLYQIILERHLTKEQRVETLENIRKANPVYFPETATLCKALARLAIKPRDREEAAAFFVWLKNRDELLRAGPFAMSADGRDLLRAVEGSTGDARPETLLRPAEEASTQESAPSQKRNLRQRLQSLLKRDKDGRGH